MKASAPAQYSAACSDLSLAQLGETQVSANVCSQCQERVIEYRFTTDGFSIITYHCARHGDVVPVHSV